MGKTSNTDGKWGKTKELEPLYSTEPNQVLKGGRGDDRYFVDHAGVTIAERNNGGVDGVSASVTYYLDENVENLELTGDADLEGGGNSLDNEIKGNNGSNYLYGYDGADRLFGGKGDDVLFGGAGQDEIDGGDGTDEVIFDGSLGDYSLTIDGSVIYVTDLDGNVDRLTTVELLTFSDATLLVIEIDGNSEPSDPAAPFATNDYGQVDEDAEITLAVLANDIGEGLSIVNVSDAVSGTVIVNDNGTITYRPFADQSGQDVFEYTVANTDGATATAEVVVDITPANDAPVAVSDALEAFSGVETAGSSLLANDFDPDGDSLTLTSSEVATSGGGTVSFNPNGTFSYLSQDGFTGTDTFAYSISDGMGGTATGEVSVNVVGQGNETPYYVDALISEEDFYRLNWPSEVGSAVTVYYTFLSSTPSYIPTDDPRGIHESFVAFDEQQQMMTRELLATLENTTNLNFVEVNSAEEATITFGFYDLGGDTLGAATLPVGGSTGDVYGDVWLDSQFATDSFDTGTHAHHTLAHELGHAMGLHHPNLPPLEENQQYTVMDYIEHPTMAGYADGYQLYDVAALQHLYGANETATSGDDVYGFEQLNGSIQVIWDSGGHDTIDMQAADFGVNIDLNDGAFSTIAAEGSNNIAIAYGAEIEDVLGSAHNDVLAGNENDNLIVGGAGDDVLSGGAGADTYGFNSGWAHDTIEDYSVAEDTLDFSGTGLTLEDLLITAVDGDTIISDGENSLRLTGIDGEEEQLDETFLLF